MKKLLPFILSLMTVFGTMETIANADITSIETAQQYELWTQSPDITSGISSEEMRLYKAMNKNELDFYELPQLGDRYYFAVCEGKMSNSGYSGKSKLSLLYYYLLLTTDDGFIIVDYAEPSSTYYWDEGNNIADVSELTAEPADGARVLYVISPSGKYTHSDWDEYNDYAFIADDKHMYFESVDDYYGQGGIPIIYEGNVYWGNDSYMSGSSIKKYTMPGTGENAMLMTGMEFYDGNIVRSGSTRYLLSDVNENNGFKIFEGDFDSDIDEKLYYKIPDSEDLYFSLSQPYTYSDTYSKYYYYDRIDIYKNTGGYMRKISTYIFETQNTYKSTLNVKTFNGVDTQYYEEMGYSAPVVTAGDKYVITNSGLAAEIVLDTSVFYYSSSRNFAMYNNKPVIIRNRNGSSYITETENGVRVYRQILNYFYVNNRGELVLDEDITLPVVSGGNEGQDGFYYSYSYFNACTAYVSCLNESVKNWWQRYKDNIFDDGRYVQGEWNGVGDNYEFWYLIYGADNKLCAIGPTGYTVGYSSASNDLIFVAAGNSKFVVSVNDINIDWTKEYYRVAVANETADGNVVPGGMIGSKNLTPPENTDTEPVQNTIDFSKEDLPIGYNIKNNVIDSEKLDSKVREQINTIRLNDIVIIKNTDYSSGVQNASTTLDDYSMYDSNMGNTSVRIYTNGQNFCWYCSYTNRLNVGTYNRYYTIGDKTVYVTFRVIEAPGNDGSVTVVF